MSKLLNDLPLSPGRTSYGATLVGIPQRPIPDLSTPPEAEFESLGGLPRHTEPPPSNVIANTPITRSVSARSPSRRRLILSETCNIAIPAGQVQQMRDGTALGLEGLARYNTWLNVLLIFVPLGVGAYMLNLDDAFIFCSCFIGMIPLAMHLSRATEDIADRTNHAFGALVNVTFGNAVEVILSISALRAGRLALIQNTLVGSILSNLLLVLGSALLWGGIRFSEQIVSHAVSESNADMLAFSVFSLSIPAIFATTMPDSISKQSVEEQLSLVTSVCLLILYCLYMFFQLVTHDYLYEQQPDVENDNGNPAESQQLLLNGASAVTEEEDEIPSLPFSFFILVITVLAVAALSELLVASLDGFSRRVGLGEKFIAIVLLPVIGNAVEHMSAILVAGHNKIDLSIGIACGSSVQIALFAAPLMVVISWLVGAVRLTLNFHTFETICVVFSVFVVNVMLRDSKSNWLEGAVLVMCYVIVASAFFFMG